MTSTRSPPPKVEPFKPAPITDWNYLPEKLFREDETAALLPTKGSHIVDFYDGRCLFVTGATGFLGKVLIEKLLRACAGLDTIYVLVRDKKGKDVHTRLDEIFADPLYSKLSKQQPKFRHKIVPIKGDVGLPGLGMCETDRELLKTKVSVIVHGAATVRFDEEIKLAVAVNVRGTREMLRLARDCPHLASFVHVSTAFAHCPRKQIDEVFYEPPFTTAQIMNIVESIPEEVLHGISPRVLGKFPNTYAFTKAIAEDTVREFGTGLPLCVFRPSIVISTYNEPIRGWIDNMYGPTGVVVGAGLGLLRTLHCNAQMTAEMVPVDLVVNSMVAASYECRKRDVPRTEIPIYNYVSSVERPTTWGNFLESNRFYGINYPSVKCIWYYNFTLNRYHLVHMVYVFLLHVLPALVADGVTSVTGSTEISLMKVYRKIHKFSRVIAYFATQEWTFTNDNVQHLWDGLACQDRTVFPFSMRDMDWNYHAEANILGLRMYLVKDDLATLPQARKKWRKLKFLHYVIKYLLFVFLLRVLYGVLVRAVGAAF